MSDIKNKIEKVLDEEIRPKLSLHGGNIELLEVDEENNKVKVKFAGVCAGCPAAGITFSTLIEDVLRKEVPEIEEIALVNP